MTATWSPPDLLQYGNGSALKDSQQTLTPFQLMTADLAAALLNRAANGAELLEILETIANPEGTDAEPTADSIQF